MVALLWFDSESVHPAGGEATSSHPSSLPILTSPLKNLAPRLSGGTTRLSARVSSKKCRSISSSPRTENRAVALRDPSGSVLQRPATGRSSSSAGRAPVSHAGGRGIVSRLDHIDRVAQQAERRPDTPEVVGSSPASIMVECRREYIKLAVNQRPQGLPSRPPRRPLRAEARASIAGCNPTREGATPSRHFLPS